MDSQPETGVKERKPFWRAYLVLVEIEKAVAVILLLAILILTFGQVVARFLFHSPFFWTEELARFSYVWLSFIASVFVVAERSHIAIQLFENRLPRRIRLIVNCFSVVAVIVVCLMISIGSFHWLSETAQGRSSALGIPTGVLYGVVSISFVAMALHSVVVIAQIIRADRRERTQSDEQRRIRMSIGETAL